MKTGAKTKLIRDYRSTPASTHDSQPLPDLIKSDDGSLHADSAYAGAPIAAVLQAKGVGNHIHEKGTTGAARDENQRAANRRKSTIRARVEHPFAFMEKSLGRIYNRCIGLVRNDSQIGLMNLCYNLCRCVQILSGRAQVPA